jgi:hypothetical protein
MATLFMQMATLQNVATLQAGKTPPPRAKFQNVSTKRRHSKHAKLRHLQQNFKTSPRNVATLQAGKSSPLEQNFETSPQAHSFNYC